MPAHTPPGAVRVVGLMSGTSYDGIDAAAADLSLEGDAIVLRPLGVLSEPYAPELRTALADALPPAATTMEQVGRLDTLIGQAFAEMAQRANEHLCAGAADLVVSHGQTVFHWVEDGRARGTLQLGQPAWIAERTGLPVLADLRARDVAAGGQGAPLVSLFDVLWLTGRPGTPVALNLGGIANITVVGDGDREPVAFDTGPANALIDTAVRRLTDGRADFDEDGSMAARGRVDARVLDELLAEPYYALPAPKTTGKELFHAGYLDAVLDRHPRLAPEDLVATLTALTARTVADAVAGQGGTEVVAAGGGVRNPVLMRMLSDALGSIPLVTSGELGMPPQAKEGYAFAVLGFLALHGLAGTVAACTGARHPSVLGSLTPGRGPLALPVRAQVAPARLRIEPAQSARPRPRPRPAPSVPVRLEQLTTESRNPRSLEIDDLAVPRLLQVMNDEDALVAPAVERALPQIASAVEVVSARLRAGGRLVYLGAGTSGRLGVLDASECPPTFGTPPGQVLGVIAGGHRALTEAVENAEDSPELARADLVALSLTQLDVVVGLTASGRTPYVVGGLRHARAVGAATVSVACNLGAEVSAHADVAIEVDNGPEVLTGSTRLKAGTSQKLVLNMLSTAAMVQQGKAFGNLMVDVSTTNAKLVARAQSIIAAATGAGPDTAREHYELASGRPKTAIVMILAGVDADEADRRLAHAGGRVRAAVQGL